MAPSRPLSGGLEVHKDAIAVADVAKDHDANVLSCGTIGTRHAAIAPLTRQLPSKATRRGGGSDAGPCGDWRSRARCKKGDACGGALP